ncbi:MAG: cyclopropane fatty acyl phospholipid synthase [Anaerolineales bacterium]|nr:cyclopropane fatty acyl phospholipid synthase [Anaerolineales bacterium]
MPSKSETIIRDLLASADIEVNGSNPWDIQVIDPRFYDRVLREVELGLGESYMENWWECQAIDQFIDRALQSRLNKKISGNWKILFHMIRTRVFNLQTTARAFKIGEQHYDLGNDLYQAMLDKRLNYTCAYWRDASNLDEAQEAKLDLVCRKIGLEPGMTVLELGCGWGSFAKYAAETYGVEVLGVTVSKEQVKLGMELCRGLPIELRLQDYREVDGTYDRVISIGVMEHVGYKNYRTYMEVVDRTLKPGGIGFFHTIGTNVSDVGINPWTEKYIFPNSMLPSMAQLAAAMEGLFVVEDWHNFGPDYDPTLLAWCDNFERTWPTLLDRYDERFYRMWRYYLLGSAGGFRSRYNQLWQVVFTRIGDPQPDCRKL